MATTITQARPLLTAAELELFDQSRTEPIKVLTLTRLRGKVTRTRTLRDKYRDLYRRQTVSVRSASTTQGRSPVGADNARTQRKADILQEVLDRFEARVSQLEAKQAREAVAAASARKVPQSRGAAAEAGKPARPQADTKAAVPSRAANRTAGAPTPRSAKAPSDKAPTANGKAQAPVAPAPTDLVPSALRGNPLKQAPGILPSMRTRAPACAAPWANATAGKQRHYARPSG